MKARLVSLAGAALALLALGCRATGPTEIPLPFEIQLEFDGEVSVDAARLEGVVRREFVRLEVAQPDKAAIDDAAFALELFYRARGHADVRVEYEFEPDPPRARFHVHEGPEVRVRELVIEGPEEMSPALVRDKFDPMGSGGIFDQERLDSGVEAVRALYLEHGYMRIAIDPPEVRFDPDGTHAAVRVVLREGPEFRVPADGVEIRGGASELAAREAPLEDKYEHRVFQRVFAPELEHTLTEDYLRHGYPDAKVRAHADSDDAGQVRIVVEVAPGERARIAHFRIAGNERTKDAAILGLLDIEPGTLYDSEVVRKAFRQLYATGLFESVELRLEGAGTERTLAVEVVEARAVQIRIEPGWGSYEGPRILLGISENNFQGRGQVLALEGTASLKAQATRIGWIDRDFFGSPFTSETTFFAEKREEPSFDFVRRGFGFFLRRQWTPSFTSSFGYEFRPTDVTDDTLPTLPQDLDSDSEVGALSVSVALDDRDNPLLPTRGEQGRFKFEWADDAFASDTEFLRAQLDFSRLFRIGDANVLAAAARTGVISPFGSTDEIPLPERYFNGGENTVRSFQEDELLPPGARGDPTGGEAATTFNLEWRRELAGNLDGALFFDWGNVAFDVHDYLDFSGFRPGVGAGVRYLLPIGPVRLDLGFNPTATDEEDDYVLHFSVGFPF